mmetsp:Transcript_15677/g.37787  ORF Transcript_15677/g.37787 Transcript_15677/m.37787 type:complete len:321 (-) Transcript_15677:224-1186(-)
MQNFNRSILANRATGHLSCANYPRTLWCEHSNATMVAPPKKCALPVHAPNAGSRKKYPAKQRTTRLPIADNICQHVQPAQNTASTSHHRTQTPCKYRHTVSSLTRKPGGTRRWQLCRTQYGHLHASQHLHTHLLGGQMIDGVEEQGSDTAIFMQLQSVDGGVVQDENVWRDAPHAAQDQLLAQQVQEIMVGNQQCGPISSSAFLHHRAQAGCYLLGPLCGFCHGLFAPRLVNTVPSLLSDFIRNLVRREPLLHLSTSHAMSRLLSAVENSSLLVDLWPNCGLHAQSLRSWLCSLECPQDGGHQDLPHWQQDLCASVLSCS